MRLLGLLWVLSSCGHLLFNDSNKKKPSLLNFQEYDNHDYRDHLASLARVYVDSPHIKIIKLGKKGRSFLLSTYKKIVNSNEFLLSDDSSGYPRFYIVDDPRPFCFSLPQLHFFFSKGLLQKYLKSEDLLAATLTREIIRSRRNLYLKKITIPKGYIETEKILSLTKIPFSVNDLINKWSYYVMKRAEYDPSAYLLWMQIQNKNAIDFTLQRRDTRDMIKEEHLFKGFVVQEKVKDSSELEKNLGNSSKGFYSLIKNLGYEE